MPATLSGVNNYTSTSEIRNTIGDYSVPFRALLSGEGMISGFVVSEADPVSASISISPGLISIDGDGGERLLFRMEDAYTLLVSPATGVYQLICLKVDISVPSADIVVMTGTVGTDPELPETASISYLPIARIVGSGSTVLAADIVQDGLTQTNNSTPETLHKVSRVAYNSLVTTVGETDGVDYKTSGVDDWLVIKEALDSGVSGSKVVIGPGDFEAYDAQILMPDNKVMEGSGISTMIYNDILLGAVALSTRGIVKMYQIEGSTVRNMYLRGNQEDFIDDQQKSGCSVLILESENCNASDLVVQDGFHGIGVDQSNNVNITNIQAWNHEHYINIIRSSNINVSNVRGNIKPVGLRDGWNQRGLFIYESQHINVNNMISEGSYTTGLFIRTEDLFTNDGCQEINISNFITDTRNISGTIYRAHSIQAATTNPINNVQISNSHFYHNSIDGACFEFLAGADDLIDGITYTNCNFWSLGYVNPTGTVSSLVKNVRFVNCRFLGELGGVTLNNIENLSFESCYFKANGGNDSIHHALKLYDIAGLKITGCTLEAAEGQDIYIGTGVTNAILQGNTAVNGRVIISSDFEGVVL